jgi:signal transduction histidine kinase
MTVDGGPSASAEDLATLHQATLGRLTRGALHEIANPLLALLGTAEFALSDTEPGTKLHSRVGLVHQTGSEIAEIVRALQAFARSASEPAQELSLAEAAETAIALVRRVSMVRDVRLVARIEAEPRVHASPGLVASRLVGLVLDGLEAAAREGTIELVVTERDGYALASVGSSELELPVARR